ncbi:uncharacterized protein LOC110189472 [Drosophila serrata]|uniref:uncharacterized protein LOC110189472 n=1 Tax=Drosophila serrata TaxID=7274 RepID=UPI000A1D1603|nr:uncharacterized protein LOC110189472 [Drosophila serrata]
MQEDFEQDQWSIGDDSLFQACGLIVAAAHAGKSIFITWNQYYLLNFRFKKPKADSSRVKMTKVRIPLPSRTSGKYLRSVHTLKFNTMLLMSDGGIYCFGSFKALHAIQWLSGVRCFAIVGNGFSVIREQEHRLLLQTYLDLPGLEKGESTLQHTFDITYDEQNIFQCDWQHDEYTLTTLMVSSEKEEQFTQRLFGVTAAQQEYVHIFSIGGHVFALCKTEPREDGAESSYHIELLCVYAAIVKFIRILPDQNLCLVFLSNGSVDMWYVSCLLDIKQRQMHHTGAEWLDYDATSQKGDFYYTDGLQLVRLRFKYNDQLDECYVHTMVKPVPGIQCCTFLEHSEQLVCLSDNNIFYRIGFEATDHNNDSPMVDFTAESIERIQHNAQALEAYKRQPAILQEALQKEYENQQLIAVGRNRFDDSLQASLEFHRRIPSYEDDNVLLLEAQPEEATLKAGSLYAVLNLTVINSQPLQHSNNWQLLICFDRKIHGFLLPTNTLLNRRCRIVVPLRKLKNEFLPRFNIKLVAFIEISNMISAVLLPVAVTKSAATYRSLFSSNRSFVDFRSYDLQKFTAKVSPSVIQHTIHFGNSLTLPQMACLFNASEKKPDSLLELYFLDDAKLRLQGTSNDSMGTLESEDASAIYYFKQHLVLNGDTRDPEPISLDQVLKFHCETQRLNSSKQNENIVESGENVIMRLESKYRALRSLIF